MELLKVKRQRLSMKRISSKMELPAIDNASASTGVEIMEVAMTRKEKNHTVQFEIQQRASNASSEPKIEIQQQAPNASSEPKIATGILSPVHFLKACSLCHNSLGPGSDTFIYRGEFAFCSRECRLQMIAKEEHRHKFERWMQTLLRSYAPLAVQAPGFELNLHNN